MPRGVYDRSKKPAPPGTNPPEPVREQVKQMSGHSNPETLLESIPESTNTETMGTPAPGEKKKREPKIKPSTDPNMNDPRYARIVSGYTGMGGQAIIGGAFDGAAIALKDETVKLNDEEKQKLDDYFYVVGKRANFDPTATLAGMIVVFAILMGELLIKRLIKHTDLGKHLKALFTPKPKPGLISKEDAQPKQEEVKQ